MDAGRLHVRGRIDELIVTGGEKVWPAEVEDGAALHPGVADCAVFGRPDPVWGTRVVAAVVPREPGAAPDPGGAARPGRGPSSAATRHRESWWWWTRSPDSLGKLRRGALGGEAKSRSRRSDDPG